MVEYGRAIGSVVGATMVFSAISGMARKGKKISMNYKKKAKRK